MPKSTAILSARGGMSIIKHLQCWTCVFPLQKSLNFSPIQLEMKSLGPKNTYWLLIFHCLFTTTSEYQGKKCSSSSSLHRLNKLRIPGVSPSFGLNSFCFFPFPRKFSVPESPFSATPFLMQFCLISTKQLLKGAAEPSRSQHFNAWMLAFWQKLFQMHLSVP